MAHAADLAISSSPRPISSLLLITVVTVSVVACLSVPAPTASDVAHAGANPGLITCDRFLASVNVRGQKGDACHTDDPRVCSHSGDVAPSEHLRCFNWACTNVLASQNNCGMCVAWCLFG